MKSWPILVLAIGVLIVGMLILRGLAGTSGSSESPIASTQSDAPRGLKGLALWLEHRGAVVEVDPVLPNPSAQKLSGASVIVPPPELERWEILESEALLEMVAEGEIDLIVLCDEAAIRQARLKILTDAIGAKCETVDELNLGARIAHGELPRWPRRVQLRGQGALKPAEDTLALPAIVDDDGRPIVLRIPHGLGVVSILASASLLTNDGLAKEDNAALALTLLTRERVVFLEGHHKLRQSRVIDEAFSQVGPKLALGAFGFAAFFVILGFAPRRGDPPRPSQASPASAAESAARGLAALLYEADVEPDVDPGSTLERASRP